MNNKDALLNLLFFYPSQFISSDTLSQKLSISKKDVYRLIRQLRSDGYPIIGKTNSGYKFEPVDKISAEEIHSFFSYDKNKIRIFSSLPSTNTTAKEMASCGAPEGTLCIAETQTHGRGRLGRDFYSPAKSGIYMSLVLRPRVKSENILLVTTMAAVAVCDAIIEITGLNPKIKWVNDIYLHDKKVCGILTEASFSTESDIPEYLILGIGVNLTNPQKGFPNNLKQIAGHVLDDNKLCSRSRMIAAILKHFYKYYNKFELKAFIDIYRARDFLSGKDVTVNRGTDSFPAHVLGVNNDLSLKIMNENGKIENLFSGDVSLKLNN